MGTDHLKPTPDPLLTALTHIGAQLERIADHLWDNWATPKPKDGTKSFGGNVVKLIPATEQQQAFTGTGEAGEYYEPPSDAPDVEPWVKP
jgi:hypothetical protein